MSDPMRIRATEKDGIVDVKILMKHDMESGQRKDASGKLIPAWFINMLNVKAQGKDVFNAEFGPGVSKDPFLNFKYKGSKVDKLVVNWIDTKGDKRTDEATVS
ncbi:thiosulfate oxidation carrier complex protein SoxZ [Polynucleobacter paneuropaeus]|uniref:thiosulfate oxidation carrier complex protein SoxZ n=1 Tax=Polynucleobacter paneuropaeus TaxID=2527775 RepID=UPI001BFDF10D|nr:thiosulfate oxidation carrier complex protein SoxZ [Polynucleobacter paneuropaeus]MBT8557640.1 thiosulfate oxidation carrier complex protein SoxZ [Polynucleobacter paneuropaeus]MBT8564139.1 thiosulfate oxidation carrier complex protein SoxZ [Polynucleobacter paneuropaeus]MBT8622364.1 thiosulfate oxidation carrier complex protein SoxZ [Polynucleobacter paneuropaeus]QWD22310.1 thiosulfate oxidation carrier complex protein SoxZ [Polynucleobacter paneuropaeus]